jgi:hypothetical protein
MEAVLAPDSRTYFEQAADALRAAFAASHPGEREVLLDRAIDLHRRAMENERTLLGQCPSASPEAGPAAAGA